MPEECFIERGGKVRGPFSASDLTKLAKAGKIRPDDFVRRGRNGQPIPARRLKGLVGFFKKSASPPPLPTDSLPVADPNGECTEATATDDGWYYALANEGHGPVSLTHMETLVRTGRLTSTDLVWHATLPDWQPVRNINGLTAASLSDDPRTSAPERQAAGRTFVVSALSKAWTASRRRPVIAASAGICCVIVLAAFGGGSSSTPRAPTNSFADVDIADRTSPANGDLISETPTQDSIGEKVLLGRESPSTTKRTDTSLSDVSLESKTAPANGHLISETPTMGPDGEKVLLGGDGAESKFIHHYYVDSNGDEVLHGWSRTRVNGWMIRDSEYDAGVLLNRYHYDEEGRLLSHFTQIQGDTYSCIEFARTPNGDVHRTHSKWRIAMTPSGEVKEELREHSPDQRYRQPSYSRESLTTADALFLLMQHNGIRPNSGHKNPMIAERVPIMLTVNVEQTRDVLGDPDDEVLLRGVSGSALIAYQCVDGELFFRRRQNQPNATNVTCDLLTEIAIEEMYRGPWRNDPAITSDILRRASRNATRMLDAWLNACDRFEE